MFMIVLKQSKQLCEVHTCYFLLPQPFQHFLYILVDVRYADE